MFEKVPVIISGKSVSVLIDRQPERDAKLASRPSCFVVGLSSHYHDKFSKEFRSFYQLILIDLYWTDGQFSPEYIDKLEIGTLSDHIEQVREQLEEQQGINYQKIFVLAHSAYGFISLNYALKYPDNVLGVINIASPLIFNNELSVKWQEEYLDSNLGSVKAGGPKTRWRAYYAQKAAFSQQEPEQTKKYFIDSYLSKRTLFFSNPILWQNQNGRAEKMWEPWQIPVFDKDTKSIKLETRDINMAMMFRYINLVMNKDCYTKLQKVQGPLLWIISLGDLRVSLYHLEDKRMQAVPKNVEFFHPAQGSHWPMWPEDSDSREFDTRVIQWGMQAVELDCQNKPSIVSKL